MRTKTWILLLTAMVVCSCGNKKDNRQVAPVKVKTEVVGVANASQSQTYTGTVEEMNGVALSFNVGGTLKQLLVSEGQMVSRGQLIAVVDAQDAGNALTMSQSAVRTAQAAYDQALDAYNRMKMIHDNGSLPEIKWVETQSQLKQAKSALEGAKAQAAIARKGVGDTRLYAPFGGYISHKDVEIGQTVVLGQAVVELVKIDEVKVKISVPETEISAMKDGASVNIKVEALDGRTYTGRIVEKNVSADPLSHTYDVKALVGNTDHKLLPGMIAEVSVKGAPVASNDSGVATDEASATASSGAPVLLPANIIQINADNRTFVWTVRGGKANKTFVTVGGNIGDKVMVSSGLHSGDRVVVEGQQKISSGMNVEE